MQDLEAADVPRHTGGGVLHLVPVPLDVLQLLVQLGQEFPGRLIPQGREGFLGEAHFIQHGLHLLGRFQVRSGCPELDRMSDEELSEKHPDMPQEAKNWKSENWGIEQMETAQMAGPVFFRRYTGKYLGKKVQIEIWTVPEPGSGEDLFITELAFKEDDFPAASAGREEMKEGLEELDILLPDDSLKTSRILNGYFAKP